MLVNMKPEAAFSTGQPRHSNNGAVPLLSLTLAIITFVQEFFWFLTAFDTSRELSPAGEQRLSSPGEVTLIDDTFALGFNRHPSGERHKDRWMRLDGGSDNRTVLRTFFTFLPFCFMLNEQRENTAK